MIGARRGSPMVVGLAEGEQFIASDIHALLPVTRRFIYLAEGDVADATVDGVHDLRRARRARAAPGQAGAFRGGRGRARRISPLHAQGNSRAAAGDRRHARRPHRERPHPAEHLRRRRRRAAATRAPRADRRLRHELPRGPRRALLARIARADSVQRRSRQRIPLPRRRRADGHPVPRDLAIRRDRRHARRDQEAHAPQLPRLVWRSATCPSRRSCANPISC